MFSSITIMDVLEHVVEQKELLDEFRRVLANDGVLIVTVPDRHVFSFLDLGNMKFRFPRLHRWYYTRKHSREAYEYRYVSNPDGLIGDISAEKRWHEHFTRRYLAELLAQSGLTVTEFDGTAFFGRLIRVFELGGDRIGPLRPLIRKVRGLDARMFESMNLYCRAKKGNAPKGANQPAPLGV
jgi:SAM-dependent methyltransferase